MAFRIAHISDLHLPPMPAVPWRQLLGKRGLGYLSWHRKRKHRHRPEVVAALESDLREGAADHICITGDITNLGLADEFRAADRWLRALHARAAITLIPGNHDAYVGAATEAMRRHLGDWLPEAFPFAIRRGPVLLIGLSTAVATAPLLATGRLGTGQLRRLAALLDETADPGPYRILLIHHPPGAGVVAARKGLTDAAELARVLSPRRVDLILHGHGHRPVHYEQASAAGGIPVFGAGSASLGHADPERSGHYHLIDIDERGITVQHRGYLAAEGRYAARGAPVWLPHAEAAA